ncbi:XdhC family protein [Sphingobium estronivorans]|uniref:XdhC family protein n=1 Tax=Sphingobium estronivorans TaxID=1577690 RepID=UPI0013C2B103|nr:XdhC family protein [Sphingobium estronivorans]
MIDAASYMLAADTDALRAATFDGAVLCTLVGVEGGFSRSVGAQFAVQPDGSTVGDMTGGCLEAALITEAQGVRETGRARSVRYGLGSPFIDIRLPCGGGVDCFIDPAPDRALLADVLARLEGRAPVALSFATEEGKANYRLEAAPPGRVSGFGEDGGRFTRIFHPRLRLLLLGIGPEMHAVARFAQIHGCQVESFWPAGRQGMPPSAQPLWLGSPPDISVDPWTAIILLFHEHEWESGILPWALASDAFFVGAMGGARTSERRQAELRRRGVSEADMARLHGPIGLIPHVKDARTLGLSILAQVVEHYLDQVVPAER